MSGFLPPCPSLELMELIQQQGPVCVPLAEGLCVWLPQKNLGLQPVPPADFWLFQISCDPSCIQIILLSQQRVEST